MHKQKGVRPVYILYTVRRVPAVSLWKQSSQVPATYQQAVSSNVCVAPVVLKPIAIVWIYNKCHVRTHIECLEPVHLMLQWVTCVKLFLACIYTYLHIYICMYIKYNHIYIYILYNCIIFCSTYIHWSWSTLVPEYCKYILMYIISILSIYNILYIYE